MYVSATIGQKSPDIEVSEWIQGEPMHVDENSTVKVIEVFQVNCPGCFMYGLPEAIRLYEKHRDDVDVVGVATAFEDFDKNTLDNLKMLLSTGKVIGDTLETLSQNKYLTNDTLPYKIPFAIGMDRLNSAKSADKQTARQLILRQIPEFDEKPQEYKDEIMQRAITYLEAKKYTPVTFERFSLNGTPSYIIVDKSGILRHVEFGNHGALESIVESILKE
ncbi:MAG: TlpA family protein disulfide reductase [Candidatus Nitrosoabyssus spongiisocia]|nr:MAG: TlpA family protein disulfide reductase [Nitrosopumilaceae archaeon AB1(1)]